MTPPGTMARVYDTLKARIMAGGFAPGERIDPARLSAELAASATPIRDALHRLAGERLVESWQQEGFRQPFVTETSLRDLLGWSEELVRIVIRSAERTAIDLAPLLLPAGDPVAAADALFGALAGLSRNHEHVHAMQSLIDRSHAVRIAETRLVPMFDDDFAAAAVLLAERRWPDVRRWNARFHSMRLRRLAEIADQFQRR